MAEKQECQVCREMMEKKHKYDIVWKVVAVIGVLLAVIFACLYFCSGEVVKETTVKNGTTVESEGSFTNSGTIGSTYSVTPKQNETKISPILWVLLGVLIGGGIIACIFISSGHRRQSNSNNCTPCQKETSTESDNGNKG